MPNSPPSADAPRPGESSRSQAPFAGETARSFRLPDFDLVLQPGEGALRGPSGTRLLTPLSRRLLEYLVDNRDRIVPREEVVREVWRDVRVTDASLRQALRVLRREVGPSLADVLVESVRGQGLRLGVRLVESGLPADPMVDRDAELAELRAEAERTRSGRGGLVLVSGPAGIGKTRLLEEFASLTARRGFRTAVVRCARAAGAPPLWAWEQILRELLEEGPDPWHALSRPEAEALCSAFPFLGDGGGGGLDPAAARMRLFEAVRHLLVELMRVRPVLLVLDDLHHMDATSLGLLEWISEHGGRVPLLAAASYRDPAASSIATFAAILGSLLRRPGARELALGPLSRDAVTRLGRAKLPGASDASLDRLWRRSGGNPFYLRIVLDEERRPSQEEAPSRLPEGVREATLEPLGGLSPESRELLRAAAVLGPELHADLLGELLALPRAAVERAIAEARSAGMVREDAPGRLAFAHALVMEALQASLGSEERARLHARVVETLAEGEEASTGTVAEHALQARAVLGDEVAADWCARAAREAAAALALEQAVHFVEQALACSADADPRRRLPLLVRLAELRGRLAGAAGAEADAARAVALARELGDSQALAETVLAMGAARGTVDDRPEPRWIARVESAVEHYRDRTPERARLLSLLAEAVWFTPEIERARELARQSIALASEIDDADAEARSIIAAFRVLQTGTGRDAPVRDELAARLASRLPDVEDRLVVLEGRLTLLWEALMSGDAPGSMDSAGRIIQEAEAVGGPHAEWWASIAQTSLAHLRGDLREAEAHAQRGLELGRSAGIAASFTNHALQTLSIRRDQGRLGEIAALLAEGVQRNPQHFAWRVAWRLAQLQAGVPAPGRELLRSLGAEGIERLPEYVGRVPLLVMLCDLSVALEEAEAASALRQQLRGLREQHVVVALGFCHWGSVARHLGRVEGVLGELDAAVAHLEEGLARDRALGAVACVARGQVELGAALGRRGGPGDAARGARLREEGSALARDLGLEGG